jgi:uncharacterized protein (TIGR02246 family)
MRTAWLLSGLTVAALGVGMASASGASDPPPAAASAAARPLSADEQAIRDTVAAFTRAFNAGDARQVADLYTPEARLIGVHGNVVEGRAAIEQDFAETFRAQPGLTIEVATDSLQIVSPDSAVEEGTAKVSPKGGGSAEVSHYTAVLVKRDGKWLQASVREYPAETLSPHEHLKELEWMVGEWVNESHHAVVHTTCHWSDDKNFLLREFHIKIRGSETLTGIQRIGWDPHRKQIRSWVFDSDGGFGEGLWSRIGNQWTIKATGVRSDGTTASSTNTITLVNKDMSQWKSVDRTLSGHVVPDIDEFVMVRKPPQPR